MKKILLCCCLVLGLAAVALPPLIEQQAAQAVRAGLAGLDAPWKVTAETVGCSFWKRTITLERLHITQDSPQAPVEYRIDRADILLPFSLPLRLAQAWMQDAPASVEVISAANATNIRISSQGNVMDCAQGHLHGLAADGSLVRQWLNGERHGAQERPWKHVTFAEAALEDCTSADGRGLTTRIGRCLLQHWNGQEMQLSAAEDVSISVAEGRLLGLSRLEARGVKALPDELYERALAITPDISEQEALAFCRDIILQEKPFLDSVSLRGLVVSEPLLPWRTENISFTWRSSIPWDSTFSLDGFSMPAQAAARPLRLRLPGLNSLRGSMSLTVTELGSGMFLEKMNVSLPKLASLDVRCIQTWTGNLPALDSDLAQLMRLTVNDAHMTLNDQGLTAYAAGNMTDGNPARAAMLALPLIKELRSLSSSRENTELADNLLKFFRHPGTLELTLRKKPLDWTVMVTHMANPAALIRSSVTAGSVPLEEQVRTIFTEE